MAYGLAIYGVGLFTEIDAIYYARISIYVNPPGICIFNCATNTIKESKIHCYKSAGFVTSATNIHALQVGL
jgi:hypothetical protein